MIYQCIIAFKLRTYSEWHFLCEVRSINYNMLQYKYYSILYTRVMFLSFLIGCLLLK